jgi:hypothetical protein
MCDINSAGAFAFFCLTFKQLGWYLNFYALFIKNILFEQKKKKIKLWNKQHFKGNLKELIL